MAYVIHNLRIKASESDTERNFEVSILHQLEKEVMQFGTEGSHQGVMYDDQSVAHWILHSLLKMSIKMLPVQVPFEVDSPAVDNTLCIKSPFSKQSE